MSRRVLVLDDDPQRLAWFAANIGPTDIFETATTAQEAIDWLAWSKPDLPFHEVYLDHDLGGEVYVPDWRKDTGSEVARWILSNRPTIGKIIVHSMNTPAANRMVKWLTRGGYQAEYISFLALEANGLPHATEGVCP